MLSLNRYACPIEATLAVVAGKWKARILWHLRDERLRYGELHRRIPDITKKMLAQQLHELVADGVLERSVYAEVPPRVEYALTDFGRTLRPVLDAMCAWGRDYLDTGYVAEQAAGV